MLDSWLHSTGADGVALYVEDDAAVLRRAAARGEGCFPLDIDSAAVAEFARIDVAGTVLLVAPADQAVTIGALELVLGQAGEIYRLREIMRQRSFQDNYRTVELESVYEVGLAIASTLDLEGLSEDILLRAVSLCDARRGALYLRVEGKLELQTTIGGEARESLDVTDSAVEALKAGGDGPPGDLLPGAGYPLAVPIEIDGRLRGLLAVAEKESREGVGPFLEGDHRTLALFANQAAIALENARLHQQALEKERLEREMELAAEIQRRLLPKGKPELPGFELTGWNRPTWQVGGDYYDFVALDNERIGLVVADATGKGMAAALMVSTLHSALRLLLDGSGVGADLFLQLNEHIFDSSSPNKFITLILVELDPASGGLRFLNAGHNPGLLVRRCGEVAELLPGGMPLGLLAGSSYESGTLQIEAGDLLCLYSDGITECAAPDEEEFGLDRLLDLLRRERERPLDEIVEEIDRATREFAVGMPQADDQTVLLLRRCG